MGPNHLRFLRRLTLILSVVFFPLFASATCPTIVQQPVNQTVCVGNQAVFSASVTNATSFQWYFWNNSTNNWVALSNNSTYSGVTTATLIINNPSQSLSGTYYTLSIGNQWCCSQTNNVCLSVNICCPTVVQQPANQTVCQGSQAVFSATLNNASLVTYQWFYWNNSTSNWVALSNNATYSGVTTSTLTINNVSMSLNGMYYALSYGNQWCCGSTNYANLCVNQRPNVSAWADKNYICSGEGVTVSASGASSYVWQPGNFTGSSVVRYPTSTTTYTVTGTASNGCTNTATVTVVVNQNPSLTATASPASICSGSSTTLTATGATNYIWLNNNQSGSTITVSPTSTTTYTVSGTNSSTGCTSTSTVTVTVLPRPTVSTSASATTICQGGQTTLTASGTAVSYIWQPGNLSGSSITVNPSATTTYTVTGTGANGCTRTATRTITVSNTSVNITITASKNPICAGEGVTLSATGAATYVWQPGNQTGSSVFFNPMTTTTYTVTGTTSAGCTGTKTITITVYPSPSVAATANPATICSGSSTTLTATGATNYIWLNNNQTAATITVSPTTTTTYTVSGTNSATGCTSTATVQVTVLPRPTVSTTASSTSTCPGNPVTITASGTAVSYVWQPGNLTGTSITVTPSTTTTYTVTGTGANGCTRTATRTITVTNGPGVTAAADKNPICVGEGVTLTATGAATYVWQPGNLSGSSVVTYPTTTTTYTVTGTAANGCTGTATVTVVVNPNPALTVNASPASICSGSSTTLTATGATNYIWLPGNQTGASISVSPSSTTTYTVNGTNSVTGCSSSATVTVTVLPRPAVTASADKNPICAGEGVTLTATGAVTYVWQPGNLTGSSVVTYPNTTTTYTVTGTAANGCTGTATVTVVVNQNPAVTATANPSSICQGSSTTLTASGATNYIWLNNNQTSATITVSPNTTTTYTVSGTNQSTGCTSTATVTVTVLPRPTISTTATATTICAGSPVTITANGTAVSYVWQPGNLSGSSITVNPATTTTYTVTGTGANGCTNTATRTITVSPNIQISANAAPATICAGGTTQITVSGATSYVWMPGNLTGTTISVSPTATTTYTVTGTNAQGCTGTTIVIVTVNPRPTVTANTSASAICVGGSATLSATGAANYVWMPGNLTGASVSVSPTSTTTYTVTGTNSFGCSATATVAVTVNPLPTVTANTSASAICVGGSATLSASGATSYVWMPGNLTGSSVSVSPTATTTYTVTGTNAQGCTGTTTVIVTVNPRPTVTANTSASAICVGGSSTLTASGATSYVWMPGNLTGSSVSVSPTSTTTYTVTGTNSFGCSSTATVAVTVNPLPTVTANTSASAICVGGSATLTASGATSYVWMPGNLIGSSVSVSPTSTTTYTVTGTNSFGCSATATVAVTVNPLPTVTANTSASAICVGGSATLSASGATSYVWMPGNLTGSSVSVSPTSTTTYTVTGTNSFGCSSTATVAVTVNPLPTVTANTSASAICVGGSATLTASGATSYVWMPGNLTGSSVSVSPTSTTTYTVTGTNSFGCSSTATVVVTVNPLPALTITSTDTVSCEGATLTLTASGASTYVWLPSNTTGSTLTDAPYVTTTYTVIGTSAFGCVDSASITITVNPLPVYTISSTADSICLGDTATLTVNGNNLSYLWQPGNQTTSSITVTPSTNTTYSVTLTTPEGCQDSTTYEIYVGPNPVFTLSAKVNNVCANTPVQLAATGNAVSYLWQPGNLTGDTVTVYPTVTTTYTVTGFSSIGCTSTQTITIIVNPNPVVSISSPDTVICAGESTVLTASGGVTYLWLNTLQTLSSIIVSPATTTTYTVIGISGLGCRDTASIQIVVNPTPVVTASAASSAICIGTSTTITASGAPSYVWMPGSLTGSSVTVNPTSTTTYTVTGTNQFGCTDTALVTVVVNPLPVLAVNTSDPVICLGDTVTFSATGASTYTWMPGNLTGSSISVTPQATTTYSVVGVTAAGCVDSTTATVTVNPLPEVTVFSHFTTICAGNSITAYASGADNYVWYPINVTGNTATFAPQQNTSYYVMGIDANGCTDTANITIYVNPLPVVNASASTVVSCAGAPVTLTATGNASYYAWTPGNLAGTSVTVNPTVTTQYILMGVDTNSCIGYDTIVVNVNPTPVVAVNSSSAVICDGDTTTLAASGAATYFWLPGNQTTASISVTPAATTTYTVIGTNAQGCSDTTVSTVVVNPLPEVTVFSHFTTICEGNSITAYASGADNYIWQPINVTGNSATFAPQQNTSYYVTGTDSNGCSDTANISIIVNPLPVVNASASVASTCTGSPVTLTANGNASYYAWQPGNMTGTSVVVNPTVTTQYILMGVDTNSCINYDTVVVNVTPAPVVQVSSNNSSVCAGGSALLTANGALTFVWMPGNLTGSNITVTPSATTTYTVTGTDANGCTATAFVTVTVNTIATVAATAMPDTICAGSSTVLNATGAATYVWLPGNMSGSSVTVTPAVTTTYTVTGTTASGCADSALVTVVVNPLPEVSTTSHFYIVCAGQSITANAYGADSFVWSPLNVSGSSVTFTPQVSATYYVTGTDSNGCSDTANLPIVVNPLPVVTAFASDTAVCSGSPVTLSANGAAYYGWQPGNMAGSSITVNPTVTTTYIVSGSDTNSCVGYDTLTVAVYTPQQVTVAANAVSICAGNTATLIANNAVSYVWMPGNITSSSITVSPSVTTTYTVTGYSAEGCVSTTTVTVVVNPLPLISVSATDTTVCTGSSTTLTATGAGNYLWLPGNFTGSSITLVPANTTTYIVTGTDNNGCTDSASITINVLPAPSVTVNTTANVLCAGDSAVLTASGATAYNWQPGNLSGNSITVTPAATSTYTVTGTDMNGCEADAQVTINVNAVPSVTASASASAVCAGEMVNLFANGASSYVWMPGNINGSSVSVVPTATTTYTVTGSDNNGCSSTATVNVTVNPIPAVTVAASTAAICTGDSATLTANGAAAYTWQPGNLNGASVTVSPIATTTYTVTGVSVDGCEDSDTVTITVNPLPVVSASASSSVICDGDTTVLSANGATAYVWMPGNTTGSTLTVSPSATTTYTVTGTNNAGCEASAVTTVTVNTLPAVNASASDTAVCAGNAVTLTATGAATYNWMPGNLSGNSVGTVPSAATTYTVTGTSAQGCTATATVNVGVNALPVTTASTSNTSICAGQTAILNAAGADTYVWMPGNLNGASVTVSPAATTTYTVTGSNAAGCSSNAVVTVNVNALPQLSLSTSDTLVCEGTTVSLNAAGADTYTWLPINVTGASVSDVPYVTTTYTVIGTTLSGCVDSAFITVQVDPLPVMILSSSADTICAGGSAVLSASGGSNYLWQPGNMTSASITVNPTATTTYSVVVSTAASCSDSSSYEIVVMPKPNFLLSSKARAICSGTSVQLTASGNAASYTWMPGNLSGSQVIVSPAVTTTYTVTGNSIYGCSNTQTITITVNQSPTVTVTSPDPILCAGESAVLNATSAPANVSFTWLPGLQISSSITVTPTTTTTYSAIAQATNGCRDTAQIVVIVNPIPTITATPDDTVVCEGDSALIVLSGAQSYTWQPGNFTGNAVYITPQGYETYTITGTSAAGCSNTTSIMIDVQTCSGDTGSRVVNQWVPVPNPGNGIFNLKGVSNGQELVIKVYSAEGRLVYEENDYPMAGPVVFPLDLTDLRSGIYLISITQGEDQQTVRVVIQQ
jgi:hypothetical protein